MVTEAEVHAALDGVIHPSFGMSLIALGMVRAVRVGESDIAVDLVMNCPGCPGGRTVLALASQVLHQLNGGVGLKLIVLTEVWKPPWNLSKSP